MGRHRKYDEKIINDAIELARTEGCKKASEKLNIKYKTVYNWCKEKHIEVSIKNNESDSYTSVAKSKCNSDEFYMEATRKEILRLVMFLKEKLYFDIDAYAEKNEKRKKEKIDFISFIYDSKVECQEGSIFQVLAKPHLENIYNEYSESCKNDKIYKIIYKKTLDKLQDEDYAMESYKTYHKADYELELIIHNRRQSIMYNLGIYNSVNELKELLSCIRENFLDGFFEGSFELKENLIKSFLTC